MHDIIKKTYELIDNLEDSNLIKQLDIAKYNVYNNDRLMNLINKAKCSYNEEEIRKIRQILLKDKDYNTYMKCYNELNLIVLKINQRYNSYFENRSCFK